MVGVAELIVLFYLIGGRAGREEKSGKVGRGKREGSF